MHQFAGTSLKTRLYLLVLAAFIPVTLLIVYVAQEQRTIEKEAILDKTRLMAQAAADAENMQVEATRDLMAAVAGAFRRFDAQPAGMSSLLADLIGYTQGYAAFGIIDPAGRLMAGSNPAMMEKVYSDRDWVGTTLEQKDLTMGAYHGERINGEPVLYIARPIKDDSDDIVAVAFAALNLNWMNRNIFIQLNELPEGSRLILMDENDVLLRYETDKRRWTLPPAFDPLLRRQMAVRASGALIAADEDGKPWLYAFARLESAFRQHRVFVVLEVPKSVALAASNRIFIRNLTLLALSAGMAMLSIWWAADVFILRRVVAMARVSRLIAAGDLRARIGKSGIRDELSHLAGVFDEMAASLQMRMEREEQVMASLERSREQLRRLSAYQNEVREQERIRIAREIHDQLGQLLTIFKMDLSWIQKHMPAADDPMKEKLEGLSRLIGEALEKLHAVTAELRPVILDDFGLAAAIEWQAEMFRKHSGIACRLENNGYEPDLPREHATALFRIFQEVLTNIIRHAQADNVIVRLAKHGDELVLQVTDNGRGITEEEVNSAQAFGLLGIRERLYPLGGRVAFVGRPGQGTSVTIHLPLPKEGDSP